MADEDQAHPPPEAPGMEAYPGSPEQQRLLRALVAYHARQPWARAFLLFGSLARGNWDAYSDLDVDVVISDDAEIEPVAEITRLCAAIGERPALIAPRRGDDGDVVLDSLASFSIRYHPLRATSPNIIASMRLLWGDIAEQTIRAAGLANAPTAASPADADPDSPQSLLALGVRATLIGAQALARGRLWSALAALEELRDMLMTLWALAHGGERPLQSFECGAEPSLQAALAGAVAEWEPASVRAALLAGCALLTDQLDAFAGGLAQLSDAERAALAQIWALAQRAGPDREPDRALERTAREGEQG